jgi:hypothetical protein
MLDNIKNYWGFGLRRPVHINICSEAFELQLNGYIYNKCSK